MEKTFREKTFRVALCDNSESFLIRLIAELRAHKNTTASAIQILPAGDLGAFKAGVITPAKLDAKRGIRTVRVILAALDREKKTWTDKMLLANGYKFRKLAEHNLNAIEALSLWFERALTWYVREYLPTAR